MRQAIKNTALSLALLFSAAAADTVYAAQSPASANDESRISAQAESVISHALASGEEDFIVVDKNRARLHFYLNGRLAESVPVLLGKVSGDNRPVEVAATPAGRFHVRVWRDEHAYRNYQTHTVVQFLCNEADTTCASLHATWQGNPEERRNQRLATPQISDNYISNGCINVNLATFRRILAVLEQHRRPGSSSQRYMSSVPLYVLPENEHSTAAIFGLNTYNQTLLPK